MAFNPDLTEMAPMARSLMKFAEPVTLRRYLGTGNSGGYATEEYGDPEEMHAVLRPGDIDVPFVGKMGEEGSGDLWMVVPTEFGIGQGDLIQPHREAGGQNRDGSLSEFEASMPKECPVQGTVVYQLDEIDDR